MSKYTPFGLKVKIAMLEQDTTTPKVAKQIGISTHYLYYILKVNRPGEKHIDTIAKIMKIKKG
jgi:hypothetical protein